MVKLEPFVCCCVTCYFQTSRKYLAFVAVSDLFLFVLFFLLYSFCGICVSVLSVCQRAHNYFVDAVRSLMQLKMF